MHTSQDLPEIFSQWVTPDCLDGTIRLVGEIVFAPAGGQAKVLPIGSLVTGARESLRVNERLYEIDSVAIQRFPVRAYPVDNSGQHVRGKALHLNPGKNQEAGIVGYQVDVGATGGSIPSDETIATSNVSGRRTERATHYGPAPAENKILEMFADRLSVPQIVVLCDESVMELFPVGTPHRNNLHGLQLLDGCNNGCFVNICPDRPNTPDRTSAYAGDPWRRQDYVARSMQRQQQPTADHVARMTVGLEPVPCMTKANGQRSAGIFLMGFDQVANVGHISSSGTSSSIGKDRLHVDKLKHR
jgi:hypothetical protein